MLIKNHLLEGVKYIPSPNTGRSVDPKFIVMHYTAGWNDDSAINTLVSKAAKVSAHLVIDTDATITQLVPFNIQAWHAGPSAHAGYSGLNKYSVGIEFVNAGYLRKVAGKDNTYRDSTGRIVTLGDKFLDVEDVIMAPNARVGSGDIYWPTYTKLQLDAGYAVTKALIAAYPFIDIVSHEEIDTRGWKTDPGPAFPLQNFRELIRGGAVTIDSSNDSVSVNSAHTPTSANNNVADFTKYVVTASSLNHRGGAGTNFGVNGKSYQGDIVVSLESKGDWIKIDSDSWINTGFIARVA